MTLEQIERFLAVAEYMSFTQAAEKLYISSSTLSKSISDLEKSLGVELLERKKQNIVLTNCGYLFQAQGARLLDDAKLLVRNVRSVYAAVTNTLTIATHPVVCDVFTELCNAYIAAHPENNLVIITEDYGRLGPLLEDGSADIGLMNSLELGSEERDYMAAPLETCGLMCLAATSHPLAERDSLTIAEINASPDLYGAYDTTILPERSDLKEYTEMFRFSRVFQNNESVIAFVRAGKGIAVLPREIAMIHAHGLKLIPVSDWPVSAEIVVTWRSENKNPALRQFLSLMGRGVRDGAVPRESENSRT